MFTYEDEEFGSFEATAERDQMLRDIARDVVKGLSRRLTAVHNKYLKIDLDEDREEYINYTPIFHGPLPSSIESLSPTPKGKLTLLVAFQYFDKMGKGGEFKPLPSEGAFESDYVLRIALSPEHRRETILSTLYHEMLHLIDWVRADQPVIKRKVRPYPVPKTYPTREETEAKAWFSRRRHYLETPAEFNVWFQTAAENLVRGLRPRDTVPIEFDAFLMWAISNEQGFAEQEFFLKGKWHRKFRVRMFQLHEYLKEKHGASVTSASSMAFLKKRYDTAKKDTIPKIRLMGKRRWIYKDVDKD